LGVRISLPLVGTLSDLHKNLYIQKACKLYTTSIRTSCIL